MRKLILLCITIFTLTAALIGINRTTTTTTIAQTSFKIEILPPPRVIEKDFDEQLHYKCLYPTVRISNTHQQRSTGFIIRSEKVGTVFHNVALTCFHCVSNDGYSVEIPTYKEGYLEKWESVPMYTYATSPKLDLAIVLFKTSYQMRTVDLDFDRHIKIGNKVSHIGCGLGDDPRYDVGYINSLKGKVSGHTTEVYRTSMHTVFGDSGGPAFYGYKVIGLMQAIKLYKFNGVVVMLTNISMCIPIGVFKTWDQEENNDLQFIYNPKAELPKLPYRELEYNAIDWDKIHEEE